MAARRLSKRKKAKGSFKWPGESGPGRHSISYEAHRGHMPYNPLASPYQTNAQFDEAVNTTAQQGIQPQLDDLTRRGSLEGRSHTGRMNDILSMYNYGTDARQKALTATSNALNSLITSNSGVDEGTRQAMAAALRVGQNREKAVTDQLGLAANPDGGQAYMGATEAQNDIGGIGLTGQFADILGGLGRDVGINEVGRTEANRNENARYGGITDDLSTERTQLNNQLPGLREQARQNLTATELTRQAQKEQQGLARTQQDLAERQFGEQQTQDKFQRGLSRRQQREVERQGRRTARENKRQMTETERANRANENINQQQVEAQKAQILADAQKAGDDTTRAALEAKAKRFDKGVEIITKYLQPLKSETRKSGSTKSTYDARVTHGYDAMLSQLMSATGAGPVEARQMILAAVNTQSEWGKRWVARASREIRSIKNSRAIAKSKRGPQHTGMGDINSPK